MNIRITKARADLLALIREMPCTSCEAMEAMGATRSNHIIERASWLLAKGLIREACRIRLASRGPYASLYEITPAGMAALILSDGDLIDSPKSFSEVTDADLARLASRETVTQRL